jgi:hypothetical protein
MNPFGAPEPKQILANIVANTKPENEVRIVK